MYDMYYFGLDIFQVCKSHMQLVLAKWTKLRTSQLSDIITEWETNSHYFLRRNYPVWNGNVHVNLFNPETVSYVDLLTCISSVGNVHVFLTKLIVWADKGECHVFGNTKKIFILIVFIISMLVMKSQLSTLHCYNLILFMYLGTKS